MKIPGANNSRDTSRFLQGVLLGEHGHIICVPFAVELIMYRQNDSTHQSSQQNPRHGSFLPTNALSLQETLHIVSFDSYYTQNCWKNKMTMKEIMKKCFFSVLAFRGAAKAVMPSACKVQGGGLHAVCRDGRCGWLYVPGWIIQVAAKKAAPGRLIRMFT